MIFWIFQIEIVGVYDYEHLLTVCIIHTHIQCYSNWCASRFSLADEQPLHFLLRVSS